MLPTFPAGTALLGAHWKSLLAPKVGHVVVIRTDKFLIKRIKKIDQNGLWVEGDNTSQSTDSRRFGYIKPKQIIAVIFMRLS